MSNDSSDFSKQWGQWSAATDQYVALARSLWDAAAKAQSAPDAATKTRAFNDALVRLQQDLQSAWLSNLEGRSFGFPAEHAFGPWGAAFQRGLANFEWPALGLTRERQQAMQRLARLTTEYWQAQMRLASQWGEVVRDALQLMGERFGSKLAAGERFTSPKQLYDLWIECGEAAFAKMAHSTEYAHTQGELTNTLSQLRSEQRQLVESVARELDLPTREELNSVHRRVKEMKAQLRALESQIDRESRPARPAAGEKKGTRASRSN
jgi:class III poly(R)-hydroxyalkanoic acid synthase PhaE subunit